MFLFQNASKRSRGAISSTWLAGSFQRIRLWIKYRFTKFWMIAGACTLKSFWNTDSLWALPFGASIQITPMLWAWLFLEGSRLKSIYAMMIPPRILIKVNKPTNSKFFEITKYSKTTNKYPPQLNLGSKISKFFKTHFALNKKRHTFG